MLASGLLLDLDCQLCDLLLHFLPPRVPLLQVPNLREVVWKASALQHSQSSNLLSLNVLFTAATHHEVEAVFVRDDVRHERLHSKARFTQAADELRWVTRCHVLREKTQAFNKLIVAKILQC